VNTVIAPTPVRRMDITLRRDMPGFAGARHFRVEPLLEDNTVFARLHCSDPVSVRGGESWDGLSLLVASPGYLWPDYDLAIDESLVIDLEIRNDEDLMVLAVVHPRDPLSASTVNLYSPLVINQRTGAGEQYVPAASEDDVGWSLRTPFPPASDD